MYIKLKNNYINLDLIKKVSEVKAYYVDGYDYKEGSIQFYSEIRTADEEACLLSTTTNGTPEEQMYVVVYGFEISYIGETKREIISIGTSRRDASKYLQSFMTLLNNNVTSVKEVKI